MYQAGPPPDGVVGSDGHWYVSLIGGNVGHDPTTDGGVHWADAIPSDVVAPSRTVPWAWTWPEDNSVKEQARWTPASRSPFQITSWASPNSDAVTYDHVTFLGHNSGVQSGLATVAGKPAWYMGFEDAWWDGAHQGCEWYISYYSPDHTSVSLFRPFYTRVQCDNNTQSNAQTFLDIGGDESGSFKVVANGGGVSAFDNPVFVVNAANGGYAKLRAKPGHSTVFFIDAPLGQIPTVQFQINSTNGNYFQAPSVDQLVAYDKNGVVCCVFNTGGGVRFDNAIGFFGTTPAAKPTVTGSRGANAALASLLTALAGLGLITNSSS